MTEILRTVNSEGSMRRMIDSARRQDIGAVSRLGRGSLMAPRPGSVARRLLMNVGHGSRPRSSRVGLPVKLCWIRNSAPADHDPRSFCSRPSLACWDRHLTADQHPKPRSQASKVGSQ